MYGKLLNLSIEELEAEIEEIDTCLRQLCDEYNDLMEQIGELKFKRDSILKKKESLRALSHCISDLILDKQREERAQ